MAIRGPDGANNHIVGGSSKYVWQHHHPRLALGGGGSDGAPVAGGVVPQKISVK